jgi:hypothetical protein
VLDKCNSRLPALTNQRIYDAADACIVARAGQKLCEFSRFGRIFLNGIHFNGET